MESVGGDGSETGPVTKKKGNQKLKTGIGASVITDYRDIGQSTNTD